MPEDDPAMVSLMVDFFYTLNYSDDIEPQPSQDNSVPPSAPAPSETLSLHADMFCLADKYQAPNLQAYAEAKFIKKLERGLSVTDLLDAVPIVFEMGPSSIKPLQDKMIIALRVLLEKAGGGEKDALMARYDELNGDCPDFFKCLCESYTRNPLIGICKSCGPSPRPMEALGLRCLECKKGGAMGCRQGGTWTGWP